MFDQHSLSSATPAGVFERLRGGERTMWRGRCGVAEYAFEEAASLPRWTLPESTDVIVTDSRVLYAYTTKDGQQVKSGELCWLWPQHLRVQPGSRSRDRSAAATQIQMVCGGSDGTFPAIVFAGGDLATVGDADRLANLIRQAIARFRLDNAEKLFLSTAQARMLSRLLIGPEFRNYQGGEGQTVSMPGAEPVSRPASAPVPPLPDPALLTESPTPGEPSPLRQPALLEESAPAEKAGRPAEESTRLIAYRPGRAADAARAIMAARAEEDTHHTEPARASWAADLAARVANLVSRSTHFEPPRKPDAARPSRPRKSRPASREPETTRAGRKQEPTVASWEAESTHALWKPEPASASWEAESTRALWKREPASASWEAESTHASGKPEPTHALGEPEPDRSRKPEPFAPDSWDTQPRHSSQEAASRNGVWEPRHADRRSWHTDELRLTSDNDLPTTEAVDDQLAEADTFEQPPATVADRAEAARRTAARMAVNAARGRTSAGRTAVDTNLHARGNPTS